MSPSEHSRLESADQANQEAEAKTRAAGGVFHRAFWLASLAIIGTGLAVHGALAYSPELANYVPESVVGSALPECSASRAMSQGGCCSAQSSCSLSQMAGGCCSGGLSEMLAEAAAEPAAVEVSEVPADALSLEAN